MKNNFERVSIITGSSGGVGQALVQEFIRHKYVVIGLDCIEPSKKSDNFFFINTDLDRYSFDGQYANIINSRVTALVGAKKLACLVNNAAVQILGSANELTREGWRITMGVNVLAPFFLSQAFSDLLQSANGCIVNISSIHATQTKEKFTAYSTSKAALSGLTRALAVALAGRVRVNGIEPAAIDTNMLREGLSGTDAYELLRKSHPVGRIGAPGDLAKLVLMVAHADDAFLTGSIFPYNGGVGLCLPV